MKSKILFIISLFLLFPVLVQAGGRRICPYSTPADLLNAAKVMSEKAGGQTSDLLQKSTYAQKGMGYAEDCLKRTPQNVGCVYFRAVNRGLEIEAKTIGIKKDLAKMIADFETVIRLDDTYDHGGAYLALGTVYLKAPSLSLLGDGIHQDLDKSQMYADNALRVALTDPQNLKLAGEIAFKKKDHKKALDYFKEALKNTDDAVLKKELKKWVKKCRE